MTKPAPSNNIRVVAWNLRHGTIRNPSWENLSETFDAWSPGKISNKEFLNRLRNLGLTECLRHSQGRLTPTFRNPTRGNAFIHQMDHLLVTQPLAETLQNSFVGDPKLVFGQGMSDHVPIVADFVPVTIAATSTP